MTDRKKFMKTIKTYYDIDLSALNEKEIILLADDIVKYVEECLI